MGHTIKRDLMPMIKNSIQTKPPSGNVPAFSPLYRQIKTLLIDQLDAGEWSAGEMIPSEAELAQRFNVSQGTVRKAIDEMAAENLLVRRQGKGTFVTTHEDPASFFRFLRLAADNGEPVLAQSQPLGCTHIVADARVANAIDLPEGAPVVHVQRLLEFDGAPVVFDDIWLAGELFSTLTLEQMQTWKHSLYRLFESQFGVCMVRAEEHLRAVPAIAETAHHLGVAVGTPLLSVERVAYTYGDKAVEWRRGLYSTARHHYVNILG